jgi:hypothetical protein
MRDFPTQGSSEKWRQIFLFLTIDGDPSSDGTFIPISYLHVVELLDAALRNRKGALSSDVEMVVRHYIQMLRRQHMEDFDLIRLARTVYIKHKAALDFIFENRPDHWSDARDSIVSGLKTLLVVPQFSTLTFVRFYPEAWKPWSNWLSQGTGWKSGGCEQLLLCEIKPDTERKRARLQLVLGPGPASIRDKLLERLRETQVFNGKPYPLWTTLVVKPWRDLGSEGEVDPQKVAERLIADVRQFLAEESKHVQDALGLAFGKR